MKQSSKIFVGMDVHKESIDITLAEQEGEVGRFGTVGGDRMSLLKAVRKLSSRGRALVKGGRGMRSPLDAGSLDLPPRAEQPRAACCVAPRVQAPALV